MILCLILIYIKNNLNKTIFHSKHLFQYCVLYENNSYQNFLTLPMTFLLILFNIFNHKRKKFSIHFPIAFNPFSKENRFDFMILSGIVSYEILQLIEEMFFKKFSMKFFTINGPIFDLIRQIGLIIIIALRYYPIYSILNMSNKNIVLFILSSFYMWSIFSLRLFQQTFCYNIYPLVKSWDKFQEFKKDFLNKYQSNTLKYSIEEV